MVDSMLGAVQSGFVYNGSVMPENAISETVAAMTEADGVTDAAEASAAEASRAAVTAVTAENARDAAVITAEAADAVSGESGTAAEASETAGEAGDGASAVTGGTMGTDATEETEGPDAAGGDEGTAEASAEGGSSGIDIPRIAPGETAAADFLILPGAQAGTDGIATDAFRQVPSGTGEVTGGVLEDDMELEAGVAGERMAPRREPAGAEVLSGTGAGLTEEGLKVSFWWTLIIMLFGASGREMYRKHLEKAEARRREEDREER